MGKQYMMFVSYRDCELLYVAHDMPKKRTIARCVHCEWNIRLTADLLWYNYKAKMGLTEEELANMARYGNRRRSTRRHGRRWQMAIGRSR